jgi:hypothetical protein
MTTPMPMSMPMPMPSPAPVPNLPTTMPEPKNYIVPKQPSMPVPQISTPQPMRLENPLLQTGRTEVAKPEPKVLLKETKTIVVAPAPSATPSSVVKIKVEDQGPSVATDVNIKVEKDPVLRLQPIAEPAVTRPIFTASPPVTPGAFPGIENPPKRDSVAAGAIDTERRVGESRAEVFEDQGSVSTKVGSVDGGSSQGDRLQAKADHLRNQDSGYVIASADDASDAAMLNRYHREKQQERFRFPEDDQVPYDDRRLEARHEFAVRRADDFYDDPYSPLSDEQPYYDDDDDRDHIEPRAYPDDDDSEHSGSIPIRTGRGEYYAEARYEERDYDRSYQTYSSSVPTRHHQEQLQGFQRERDVDRAEWSDTASLAANNNVTGYAREQYPAPREYPARPTLDDREREMELRNQKIASSAPSTTRPGYGRRPGTAPGTVAHLRRRFSDQSVSDMTMPPTVSRNIQPHS